MKLRRLLYVIVLAVLVLVWLPVETSADELVDKKTGFEFISSKYDRDSKAWQVYENMPEMRAKAVETIERKLGIIYEDNLSIVTAVRDIGAKRGQKEGILKAQRVTEQRGKRTLMVVNLFAEYIENGMMDPQKELTHEMTHAVMRELLGRDKYISLPRWFREGTAVYCAEQGDERIDFVFSSFWDQGLDTLVNGLDGEHGYMDYPEDYLAFRYLEEMYGVPTVKEVIANVMEGRPYREAISLSIVAPYPDFHEAAKKYALESAYKWRLAASGMQYFEKGKTLYAKGVFEEAAQAFRSALQESRVPTIIALCEYYLARCYYRSGDYDRSAKLFAKVADKARYTFFADRGWFYPAFINYQKDAREPNSLSEEEFAETETALERVVRDYPYSSRLHDSWYYLAHLKKRNEKLEEAAWLFCGYCDEFEEGKYEQACHLNAAECFFELEKYSQALEHAKEASIGDSKKMCQKAVVLRDRIREMMVENEE
ncbi:MAG: hypothetical protein U5N86_12315 [Planctomycetota bacterium]|nr:hypothetical protein [Planctomycetota bacterium]